MGVSYTTTPSKQHDGLSLKERERVTGRGPRFETTSLHPNLTTTAMEIILLCDPQCYDLRMLLIFIPPQLQLPPDYLLLGGLTLKPG